VQIAKTARRAVPHWMKLCDWEVTYAAAEIEAPALCCVGGWARRRNGAEHPVSAGSTWCSTAATGTCRPGGRAGAAAPAAGTAARGPRGVPASAARTARTA